LTSLVRRQTLADLLRRTAARLPNKTAIRCGDTAWSWHEFDLVVSRLAAGLHGCVGKAESGYGTVKRRRAAAQVGRSGVAQEWIR